MLNTKKISTRAAYNGRFGVMAAVTPQKRQCENERLYPAGSFVEAATTPSRLDVMGKFKETSYKKKLTGTHNKKENLTIYIHY